MNPFSHRPLPPVFSSEQEQNKAECAAIWYTYAGEAELQDDLLGARMGFMCAWKEQPQELRYFQALVNFLDRSGFVEELFKVYEIGSQLFASHVPTWVNYSALLNQYGEYERGMEAAERALMVDSHCLAAWGNLGNALRGMGEYSKAASCFEKILKGEPENAMAAFNLASVYLATQDFERGFYYYDNRLNLPGYERLQSRNASPVWDEEYLEGQSILVYAEQGLGDTLMFARYVQFLIEKGADKVVFEVQKPLFWFLKSMASDKLEVIFRDSLDKPCAIETDYQLPLLSLAHYALSQRGTLATEVPYLRFPDTDAPRASEKLRGMRTRGNVKVGLCWQGNPHAAVDCGRSIDLDSLRPLLELETVEFVSLQGRDGLEELKTVAADFENLQYLEQLDGKTRAFEETLCLMQGMDLVITTDTAIAHLAGALGKPCWLMLQRFPEWRWGRDSHTSFWYPQMRLFRQTEIGDWDNVIGAVVCALQETAMHELADH